MQATESGAGAERRAALARDLADANEEMARVRDGLDRYEKMIEVPRLLADIRHLEAEIRDIDEA